MVSSNFQNTFLLFWHKIRCIVIHKKQKLFVKKNANHTISIHGKCMTSIFLMATIKNFQSIFEIAPKFFLCFFFQPRIDFRTQTNIFEKFSMQNLIFCVYKVVLDRLILDFFPFLLIIFFKLA